MTKWLPRLLCAFQIAVCLNCSAADGSEPTLETVRDAWANFETVSKSVSGSVLLSTADDAVSRESYLGTSGGAGVIMTQLSREGETASATALFGNEQYLAAVRCDDWEETSSYREASEKNWKLGEVEARNENDQRHRNLINSPNLLLIGQNHKLNEVIFGGNYDVEIRDLGNGDTRIVARVIDETLKSSKMKNCEAVLDSSQQYVLKSLKFTTTKGLHENVYKYRNGGPIPLLEHATFRESSGDVFEVQADIEISGEVDEKLFTLSHFGLSEPAGIE